MVLGPAPVRLGLTCRSWDVAGHDNGTALEQVTGRLGVHATFSDGDGLRAGMVWDQCRLGSGRRDALVT